MNNQLLSNMIVLIFMLTMGLGLINLSSCSGCSESGRRARHEKQISKFEQSNRISGSSSNIVQMRRDGGVYLVPIEINGVEMEFIFDTGASIISISAAEVIFLLRQNKLSEDDFLGSSYFTDATGAISEGTLINLREVQIGSRTLYNVRASVVHNLEAPLLLGQSALQQFGKVTIDYNKNQLIFD